MTKAEKIGGIIGVILFSGFCILAIIAIIGLFVNEGNKDKAREPFKAFVHEYSNIPNLKEYFRHPYIHKKFIIIDKEAGKIDDIHFELPDSLRATNPEEVGTVIWLEWGREHIGHYRSGALAIRQTSDITIIDKNSATIVGKKRVSDHEEPPDFKENERNWISQRPTSDVFIYIEYLQENLIQSRDTVMDKLMDLQEKMLREAKQWQKNDKKEKN